MVGVEAIACGAKRSRASISTALGVAGASSQSIFVRSWPLRCGPGLRRRCIMPCIIGMHQGDTCGIVVGLKPASRRSRAAYHRRRYGNGEEFRTSNIPKLCKWRPVKAALWPSIDVLAFAASNIKHYFYLDGCLNLYCCKYSVMRAANTLACESSSSWLTLDKHFEIKGEMAKRHGMLQKARAKCLVAS